MSNFARSPWLLLVAASLWPAPATSAVIYEWVTVGNPGNACHPRGTGRCFGAVGYTYRIATHEVTNAQYVEFLNAKAASDPLALYNADMASVHGGIARSGTSGSYTYSVFPGRANKPVGLVSYFDALRFANWLHNGQGTGDTETGAYTLLGGTPTPSNPLLGRNPGATVFLPTDAEWYKAAYYDGELSLYYNYPAGTDAVIVCSAPTATPNRANCGMAVGDVTDVGSYAGSASPSGTFDQGGNASEWVDFLVGVNENRPLRGGVYSYAASRLRGMIQEYDDPWYESLGGGFRMATLAEGEGGVECGNGLCQSTEDPLTCPGDCPDLCGDGLCSGDEDALSCSRDCPDRCGDGLCTGRENASICPQECVPVCGDGFVEGPEQCEAGVPLAATCKGLGFAGGTLACHTSVCAYNTSGCTNIACLPRLARCSSDAQCCSGDCRLGRCRGN